MCLENVAVQLSSHNWPTDINECLKLGSMSASDACCETFGSRRLYRACAMMLAPLGIITCGVLAVYGTYCCVTPSPIGQDCDDWCPLFIPNRDSPNGYSTVMPAELQFVTLSH